ncbi:MAG: type II toxin-antitoxin system RelE/ParE family toxin [Chitinophagaceae bacterium]|nr:type II toxin-antitoxin system RelE/ParE family toxin [Chitinophagaceae bacterium]
MPEYIITLSKTAQKQSDKLPNIIANSLIESISQLAENPRPYGYKKLKGRDGYRIRQGDFRIICDVYDRLLTVEVIAVGHRKDIYD